jgi:hypothetical protein
VFCDLNLAHGMNMLKFGLPMLLALGCLIAEVETAKAADLQGSWSGGGTLSFASGATERARCRVRYTRRSNEGYVVDAVCATSSARAAQTASLRKIAEDRYGGHFYNSEYGISGTIVVMVHGNTQSVRLSSEAGWALLKLSR